jgi:hypothetical protein
VIVLNIFVIWLKRMEHTARFGDNLSYSTKLKGIYWHISQGDETKPLSMAKIGSRLTINIPELEKRIFIVEPNKDNLTTKIVATTQMIIGGFQ